MATVRMISKIKGEKEMDYRSCDGLSGWEGSQRRGRIFGGRFGGAAGCLYWVHSNPWANLFHSHKTSGPLPIHAALPAHSLCVL